MPWRTKHRPSACHRSVAPPGEWNGSMASQKVEVEGQVADENERIVIELANDYAQYLHVDAQAEVKNSVWLEAMWFDGEGYPPFVVPYYHSPFGRWLLLALF